MNNVHEATDNQANAALESQPTPLFNTLTASDWHAAIGKSPTNAAAEPSDGQLSFDNIYAKPLAQDAANIASDAKALQGVKNGSAEYKTNLAKLDTDEKAFNSEEGAFRNAAPNFSTFSKTMEAEHVPLKEAANKLWKMGLKGEAGDTTAYYPLSQYEHQFTKRDSGGGTGPGGGNPPPTDGSTEYALDGSEKVNAIANQIGGSGNIQSASATELGNVNGQNEKVINVVGGSDGDVCLTEGVKTPLTENPGPIQTVTMKEGFSFTQAQLNNLHEFENDLPTGAPKGSPDASEMMATQINAHTGELDIGGPNGGWGIKNAGNLGGPIVAGKEYQLEISMTENQTTHTATMNAYDVDGVNLLKAPITFKDIPLGWGPGDFVQTQLDLLKDVPNGSQTGVTEYNKTLSTSNKPYSSN